MPNARSSEFKTEVAAPPVTQLRDYGKVLEFPSLNSDCIIRIDREIRSARTEVALGVKSEDRTRWRRETLGPPNLDLLDDLRTFRAHIERANDDVTFIRAIDETIRRMECRRSLGHR